MAGAAGGRLQVHEDMRFERRAWVVQRIGWGVIALLLVAAVLGCFGRGPLSSAEARAPDGGLRVQYERFGRIQTPLALRVVPGTAPAPDGTVRIWVSSPYLSHVRVEGIVPAPREVVSERDRLVYVFAARAPGPMGEVVFHLEPQAFGGSAARVGVVGGPETAFSQFIFP